MRLLDGSEVAGFIKERQASVVRGMQRKPKLVIFRSGENLVIDKYVGLKKRYGEDIGVAVEERRIDEIEALKAAIREANADSAVDGIIVQLPLAEPERTDEVLREIDFRRDVDGLRLSVASERSSGFGGVGGFGVDGSSDSGGAKRGGARFESANSENSGTASEDETRSEAPSEARFESATATAILWLLDAYDVRVKEKKVAVVGYGRLVGKPLVEMLRRAGVEVEVFDIGSDLMKLKNYDLIITATGVPRLITPEMVRQGCVIVDAGTASEGGVIVGDVDERVRESGHLRAITPVRGGVGPLTVAALFENVIRAGREERR